MNFYMQSEGSPTAFTEFTVRDMICGAGLCSIQGSVLQHGVTGSRHRLCVHIYIYIYIYIYVQKSSVKAQQKCRGGGLWGTVNDQFHKDCDFFKFAQAIRPSIYRR